MSDRYSVHLTKTVEADLNEFGPHRARVVQELLTLETKPYAGHTLKGSLRGLRALEFSLPGGECRAVYKVREDRKICVLVIAGFHENIYEKAERRVKALKKQGLPTHTATMGWYEVNATTGEVKDALLVGVDEEIEQTGDGWPEEPSVAED